MKISVNYLTFGYGRTPVLKGIFADFQPGITALVGPNGAGKSTLIKCLAGILPVQKGIVFENISNPTELISLKGIKQIMSYLPQTPPDVSDFTVFEMILLGLIDSLGLCVGEAEKERVNCMLGRFDLGHLALRRMSELSGGQQQMISLVQALIKEPLVLLLDEPLNNLDFHHQFEILDHLAVWTRAEKRITIMAIHDLNLASRYADRILVLKDGEVAGHGSPMEVMTTDCIRSVFSIEAEIGNQNGVAQIYPIAIAKN